MKKWCVIAGVLVIMLTGGCTGSSTAPTSSGELAVIDHNLTSESPGQVIVNLTVKNVGVSMVELAQVTVNFLDAQGNLIDSSGDAVMNLLPGESWHFEIVCTGANCGQVKGYELETMAGTSSGS